MKIGDIIAVDLYDGQYMAYKILREDAATDTVHCLAFQPVAALPKKKDLPNQRVLSWHVPKGRAELEAKGLLIDHGSVKPNELVGYYEYLKQTDWPLYASETEIDVKVEVARARRHYQKGCALADEGQYEPALKAFSAALDCFPLLYEALDNRGLTQMDLGRFREAISDFDSSLNQNRDSILALFSKGECYLKLGDYPAAAAIFLACVEKWPNEEAPRKYLQLTLEAIKMR